jgi:chemotaxis protein MotA
MEDPAAIGPAMAVALLTMFYGVIGSELIFRPAAASCLVRTLRAVPEGNVKS